MRRRRRSELRGQLGGRLRHHKRTRILVGLGTEREDGHFWSDPGDWTYTTLVR
jgi:hypothetical protein